MGGIFSAASSCSPADKEEAIRQGEHGLTGMPGPWTVVLVGQQLDRRDKLALFSTCKELAQAVSRHSNSLTLQLTATLRNSRRRAFVLGLAANNTNVHLHLIKYNPVLDMDHIWPCITQLTLCDVPLNSTTMQTLHVQQMVCLHTLTLTTNNIKFQHSRGLDTAAVSRLVQAEGLRTLHTLQVSSSTSSKDVCNTAQQLASILGDQVKYLALLGPASCGLDQSFGHWPVLTHLTLSSWESLVDLLVSLQCHQAKTIDTMDVQEVYQPPVHKLDVLELLNPSVDSSTRKVNLRELSPTNLAHCLHIRGGITFKDDHSRTCQGWHRGCYMSYVDCHLKKWESVKMVPEVGQWDNEYGTGCWDTPDGLPAVTLKNMDTGRADMCAWLLSKVTGPALRLCTPNHFGTSLVGLLPHIPACVNVLWLSGGCKGWQQLFASIPPSITHVIFDSVYNVTDMVAAMESGPPPIGLTKLRVGGWSVGSCEATIKDAVAAHWPGVQVHVHDTMAALRRLVTQT